MEGDVHVVTPHEIRPNLICHDHDVMLGEHFSGAFELFALPHASTRVERRAHHD